jgi:hypothetical protein
MSFLAINCIGQPFGAEIVRTHRKKYQMSITLFSLNSKKCFPLNIYILKMKTCDPKEWHDGNMNFDLNYE